MNDINMIEVFAEKVVFGEGRTITVSPNLQLAGLGKLTSVTKLRGNRTPNLSSGIVTVDIEQGDVCVLRLTTE